MRRNGEKHKLIVVLGMHRSGTSAAARGMKCLGAELGDNLLPALIGNNDKGFWEDVDLNQFNDEMLRFLGQSWSDAKRIRTSEIDRLILAGFLIRAKTLLLEKVGSNRIFAIKDPRLAKLGLFWARVFSEMDDTIYFLHVYRNPLSVFESLAVRDGFDESHCSSLWVDHVISSMLGARSFQSVFLNYDRLMAEPRQELERVAGALGLSVIFSELAVYCQEFLESSLRHTHYSIEDLICRSGQNSLIVEIFQQLEMLGTSASTANGVNIFLQAKVWDLKSALQLKNSSSDECLSSSYIVEFAEEINGLHEERDDILRELKISKELVSDLNDAIHALGTHREQLLTALATQSVAYQNSLSWRITSPLRSFGKIKLWFDSVILNFFTIFQRFLRYYLGVVRAEGGHFNVLMLAFTLLRKEGVKKFINRLHSGVTLVSGLDSSCVSSQVNSVRIFSGDAGPAFVGKIAVHVHAYYVDLLAEILINLRNIPHDYSLFVSVCDAEAKYLAETAIRDISPNVRSEVRVVKNIGRDIAPFVTEFSQEICAHDYFLHLHTKKSLYTGGIQDGWRAYLIENLIGSSEIVQRMLSLMYKEKGIGVIYPETYIGVPYWAHSWLKNVPPGAWLSAKLGIDLLRKKFMDAPMGSMFWCKVDAIRPLLVSGIELNDFPEETGQNDGTLQHAIERSICLVAANQGYFSAAVESHRADSSLLNFTPRRGLNRYRGISQIFEHDLMDDLDVVSFDIFDTLLVRCWLHPWHLHAYIQDIAQEKWGISGYLESRTNSDTIARARCVGVDANIYQIYDVIRDQLKLTESDTQNLLNLEIALEVRSAHLSMIVESGYKYCEQLNKRILLVSDMYLPQKLISQLIKSIGLGEQTIEVSCGSGYRKDNGTMWRYLPDKYSIPPKKWLHVGDNTHSDIQNPVDMGFIHPVHVFSPSDQLGVVLDRYQDKFSANTWQTGLLQGLIAKGLFADRWGSEGVIADLAARKITITDPRAFGYVLYGPMLVTFMAWLMGRAVTDGVSQLLYASREGYMLQRAHAVLEAEGIFQCPKGRYMLTSRVAVNRVLIDAHQTYDHLITAHFCGTLEEFLVGRLGLSSESLRQISTDVLRSQVSVPGGRDELLKLLRSIDNIIKLDVKGDHGRYIEYIDEMSGGNDFSFVDVGYQGTIQSGLANVLDSLRCGYYCVTTRSVRQPNSKFSKNYRYGCFGSNIDPYAQEPAIYRNHLLIESVMTAPDGQFIRFDQLGSAVYREKGIAQLDFQYLELIQDGALRYFTEVLRAVPELFLKMASAVECANLPFILLNDGVIDASSVVQRLRVEDSFSGNGELQISV